jgi:hypothetical protein
MHLAFIVGSTAAIEVTVAGFGFKGRGGPEFERLSGLNVVMTVEEYGGLAGCLERFGIDEGMKIGGNDFDLGKTGGAEVIGDPGGGALDVLLMLAFGADGRNAEKFAKFGEVLVAASFDKFSKVHIRPSGTILRGMKKIRKTRQQSCGVGAVQNRFKRKARTAILILRPAKGGHKRIGPDLKDKLAFGVRGTIAAVRTEKSGVAGVRVEVETVRHKERSSG